MITFDEYKIDCEYFEREEIKSKNFNNSYIPKFPTISENCNHSLAGKICYSENNLCPYNIKNDDKTDKVQIKEEISNLYPEYLISTFERKKHQLWLIGTKRK